MNGRLKNFETGSHEVAVNPALVRAMTPSGDNRTRIIFDHLHYVVVEAPFREVVDKLSLSDLAAMARVDADLV